MASQNINVGTTANDGTGESLRSAFIDIRKMFAEVYGQTYTSDTQDLGGATFEIDSDQIVDGAIDEVHLNATNSPSANQILQWDGSTGFTWVDQFDGDITSVVAGDGLTGGATEDDATLNVVGGDGITANANEVEVTVDDSTIELSATDGTGAVRIKNDGVTHDKLENRYTEAVTVSTLTGTYSLDWSAGAVFAMSGSLTGGITFQFSNMKIGQVIDIYNLTGAQTVTFSTASGTPVFNKAGAVDYAGASTNLIQVQCVSDAANAVFNYAVSTYVSDATPS